MSETPVERRPSADLSGPQRRHLRALAHHLKNSVLVGKTGLSDALVGKVATELERHELIKVRFGEQAALTLKEGAQPLADAAGAHLAQTIGKIAVLYREREEQPEIRLPKNA